MYIVGEQGISDFQPSGDQQVVKNLAQNCFHNLIPFGIWNKFLLFKSDVWPPVDVEVDDQAGGVDGLALLLVVWIVDSLHLQRCILGGL